MRATRTPPAGYLQLLRRQGGELFREGDPFNYERKVATTWGVSLAKVRERTPAAQDLLTLCAFLAPDDVPRRLLSEQADILPERLRAAVANPIAYTRRSRRWNGSR
jgi:hypothetical protein